MSREHTDQYTERYIALVNQVPDLSEEEERNKIRAWREQGDIKARDDVVNATMKVAVAVARQHRNFGLPIGDMLSLGADGILEAVRRYDLSKEDVRFKSYAWYWIRAKITRAECRQWHMVSGQPTSSHRLFSLLKAIYKAHALHGNDMGAVYQYVGESLGIPAETAREWITLVTNRMASLDVPSSHGEHDRCMKDRLVADHDLPVDEQNEIIEIRKMVQEKVQKLLPSLSPRQVNILNRRLLCDTPDSLDTVAHQEGVSGERIRQIENVLKDKLRKLLRDEAEEWGIDTERLMDPMIDVSFAAA